MSHLPAPPDPWESLRALTPARLAPGRAGGSLPTRAVLDFAHDHALARDAVSAALLVPSLARELENLHSPVVTLASAAPDRPAYLRRPDLGRRLAAESRDRLAILPAHRPDLVIIVSDGLSALAAERQAPPLLAALLPKLRQSGFELGPLCLVSFGRVALQDEIGGLLEAGQSLMLLGERPGLGTPDSLGAYLTYAPRPGRTDAERNCVSNIRPGGLEPAAAAECIFRLLAASRRLRLSGIKLKDDGALLPEST